MGEKEKELFHRLQEVREGGREGGREGLVKKVIWNVGRYGCQNDGLGERDTMVREGGREGGEGGREGVNSQKEGQERYFTTDMHNHSPLLPPSLPPSLPSGQGRDPKGLCRRF